MVNHNSKHVADNELYMTEMDLRKFTWTKKDGSLVAEASDFGPLRDGRWWLQRIYNDACDIGIAIRSHVTETVEKFYLQTEHERDGDLTHWTFLPLNPNCKVKHVTIFND
jgi:hypothetical protein